MLDAFMLRATNHYHHLKVKEERFHKIKGLFITMLLISSVSCFPPTAHNISEVMLSQSEQSAYPRTAIMTNATPSTATEVSSVNKIMNCNDWGEPLHRDISIVTKECISLLWNQVGILCLSSNDAGCSILGIAQCDPCTHSDSNTILFLSKIRQ